MYAFSRSSPLGRAETLPVQSVRRCSCEPQLQPCEGVPALRWRLGAVSCPAALSNSKESDPERIRLVSESIESCCAVEQGGMRRPCRPVLPERLERCRLRRCASLSRPAAARWMRARSATYAVLPSGCPVGGATGEVCAATSIACASSSGHAGDPTGRVSVRRGVGASWEALRLSVMDTRRCGCRCCTGLCFGCLTVAADRSMTVQMLLVS